MDHPTTPKTSKSVSFGTSSSRKSRRASLYSRRNRLVGKSNNHNIRSNKVQALRRNLVESSSSVSEKSHIEKENQVVAREQSDRKPFGGGSQANVGSCVNSLRRSLRATVVAKKKVAVHPLPNTATTPLFDTRVHPFSASKGTVSTNGSIRAGGNSPATPNSILDGLLEGEMDMLDAEDESLLITPNTSLLQPQTPLESKPRTSALKSATTSATKSTVKKTTRFAKSDDVFAQQSVQPTPDYFQPATKRDMVASTQSRINTALKFSGVHATTQNETAAEFTTPFRARGNGVCMDLSTMFVDEHKSARKVNGNHATRTPMRSATPSQTSLYTNVNSLQDNNAWANKQCETFSNWLDYTLHPSEDQDYESALASDVSCGHDRAALRTLILHRRMALVRANALALFSSDEMKSIRVTITTEISKGKLAIRKDRDMYRNLHLRKEITSLLLSYSTPWLRLGLEAIFGETILPEIPHQFSPTKNSTTRGRSEGETSQQPSRMRFALKEFIKERVLSDSNVLAKYTKKGCKVPSGKFEKLYNAELRSLVLYRLMVLIFFLDRAKEANILDKFPRLFTKKSEVKSTKAVLEALCRDFLENQGNITKNLARVGLKVTYKQDAIDEIDLSIRNLAVDLRDGVRLTRMTEILTGANRKALLVFLRLPAVSRLQKLHNVGIALQALRKYNVPITNEIAAHHIVDGHREMVLNLMWTVVAYCCLRVLLGIEKLEGEIKEVVRTYKIRKLLLFTDCHEIYPESTNLPALISEEEKRILLLLRWCQSICSCFGLEVVDFTNSFADGRAVCLLIHYYHPEVLDLGEILPTSNELPLEPPPAPEVLEQRRENERTNSQLANLRMSGLGGIPRMIPISDTSNIPDEKSVILCLSYMFSRLRESSTEIRACILIQYYYRRHRAILLAEKKRRAALVIFQHWCENKDNYYRVQYERYAVAVSVIEEFFFSYRESIARQKALRLELELQNLAAVMIQACIRGYAARQLVNTILAQESAAKVLQCLHRQYQACKILRWLKIRKSAVLQIQRWWRFSLQHKIATYAATRIQAIFVGYWTRVLLHRRLEASICIQRVWRGFWAQLEYQMDLLDIIAVQSLTRRHIAIHYRKQSLHAVVLMQTVARGYLSKCMLERKRVEREKLLGLYSGAIKFQCVVRRFLATKAAQERRSERAASTTIQSIWRVHSTRSKFTSLKLAAIQIQALFRRNLMRVEYGKTLSCTRIIQRSWRAHHCRVLRVVSATVIQCCIRNYFARIESKRMRDSVEVLQCAARVLLARSTVHLLRVRRDYFNAKVVICQSLIRRNLDLLNFIRIKQGFIKLQALCRSRQTYFRYHHMKTNVITIQSLARSNLVRWRLQFQSESAVICQARIRSFLCVRNYWHAKEAAIALQAKWREFHQRIFYQQQKFQIIRLQASIRGYFVRLEKRALEMSAMIIQKTWRMFSAYLQFQLDRSDVMIVQCVVRRQFAYRKVALKKAALQQLQQMARIWLAKRHLLRLMTEKQKAERERRLRNLKASKTIQSVYRGYLIRREVSNLNAKALKIQTQFRGFLCRLQYQIDLIDIVIVQSLFRRFKARREFIKKMTALVYLQQAARMWNAKEELSKLREAKKLYEHQCSMAVQVQRMARGHIARSFARKEWGARMIQKTWRCYTTHIDYMLCLISIYTIQSVLRGFLCRRKYVSEYSAISRIQAFARGNSERKLVVKRKRHVISIQSCVRMFLCRKRYCCKQLSAIVIQSCARGFFARYDLAVQRSAATDIQRTWRGFLANIYYCFSVFAIIKIQSGMRMKLAKNQCNELRYENLVHWADYMFFNKKAAIIQQSYRNYIHRRQMDIAACIIQEAARSFLESLAVRKVLYCIIRAQSIYRGHLVRNKRTKRVRLAASRIKQATVRADRDPRLKLGARTRAALAVLRRSTKLTEIKSAVCTLEMATRHSKVCCIAFVEAQATLILFSLIRTCNRSIPHVELLHFILLTMMNVAQYDDVWASVDIMSASEVFLDLVQMFRDKESVFGLAVVLLEKCVKFDKEIENMCKSVENLKRLKGIHSICMRKLSQGRPSMGHRRQSLSNVPYDIRFGVRTLEHVISLLDT